jgi:Histone acetyltransferase subunit NuA4
MPGKLPAGIEDTGARDGLKIEKERRHEAEPAGVRPAGRILNVLRRAVDDAAAAVRRAEEAVAEAEDKYINMTWTHGNLMRGWEGYCRRVDRAPQHGNGSGTATGAPKQRKVRPSDRMFSMTSSTSAIRRENSQAEIPLRKGPNLIRKKKKR